MSLLFRHTFAHFFLYPESTEAQRYVPRLRMGLYPARTMPERDETKWKVVVIFSKEACISSLLKRKTPRKTGNPDDGVSRDIPTLPLFQDVSPAPRINQKLRTYHRQNE